jgi:microcystin degradation protein MlrC
LALRDRNDCRTRTAALRLMRRRVFIAGLFHETHTFLDGTTPLADFHILRGDEMLRCAADSSPLGGVLAAAREYGWEVVPAVDYRAQPSAIVEDAVIESFWRELAERVEPGIDAIYLVLHGAMVSPSLPDVEGEVLARLRQWPRLEHVPIFGVFDLHANFTPRMAALSDCLVAYRENPHTDARDAACRAAAQLQRCLTTGERPVQRCVQTPILWPPTGTGTADEPMKSLEGMARELEQRPGVWCVNVVAGFAFADTEFTGVSFVASGTDARALDARLAALAENAWALRECGNVTDPPIDAVMARLARAGDGLTVLVEPSDNIGGGAPGDGTGLLRALLAARVPRSAVCIADPAAVDSARVAGVGAEVTLSIGGKGSRLDQGPVELAVRVVSLRDGRFTLEDPHSHLASMCGDRFDMGPCAVVQHAGLTILLTSVKTPPFDLGQWRSQGIEPRELSVIVVKAAVAHRCAYDPIAARMWRVETPGPCSSDVKSLPYRKIRRPIYPLDP